MKIIQNHYTLDECYFIPLKRMERLAEGYTFRKIEDKWHIYKSSHSTSDIDYDDKFEVVGNINLKQIVLNEVLKAIEAYKGSK